jgi:hypothetical protein
MSRQLLHMLSQKPQIQTGTTLFTNNGEEGELWICITPAETGQGDPALELLAWCGIDIRR